jgi:hypothetical protein
MVKGFLPGWVLTFSATGSMSYSAGTPTDPTDGRAGTATYTGPGVFVVGGNEYGMGNTGNFSTTLSRYAGPYNALLGVFLGGSPPAQPASSPAGLDFTSAGLGTGFASLSPALGQVFFIGDGLTGNGTGAVQQFTVPAGATALYLGGTDGYQYAGDTGYFTVTVGMTPPAGVTTSVFKFGGSCSDCTNPSGTLYLQNYTLNQAITAANFVSFIYSSNVLNFTLLPSDNPLVSGMFVTSLPAPANISLVGPGISVLTSLSSGSWCGGLDCASDKGSSSTWSMASGSGSLLTIPTLSTPALVGMALVMAALGVVLLKRRRARSAA